MRWIPIGALILGLLLLLYIGTDGHWAANLNASNGLVIVDRVDRHPLMRIIVTLALLGTSAFVILSKRFQPRDKYWAYATVGMVVGFWLPG